MMFLTDFSGENLKQFYSFLTEKQLINFFLVDPLHIHQNIDYLFVTIQSHQVKIEKCLQSTGPPFIEFQDELLQTNFLLLQSRYLESINLLRLLLSVFIQAHSDNDGQAQKIVLN
jgi:hypothetical protein